MVTVILAISIESYTKSHRTFCNVAESLNPCMDAVALHAKEEFNLG